MSRQIQSIPNRGRWVVLFVGNDCPYCESARNLLSYASALAGVNTIEVNAHNNTKLANLYHVQSVPTAIKVNDGHVIGEMRGRMLKKALEAWVNEW